MSLCSCSSATFSTRLEAFLNLFVYLETGVEWLVKLSMSAVHLCGGAQIYAAMLHPVIQTAAQTSRSWKESDRKGSSVCHGPGHACAHWFV